MKHSTIALVGAAALGLSACGGGADTNTATVDTTANTGAMAGGVEATPAVAVSPGQAFANTAAASDAFEIATSQLALQKSSSAAIKKFAQQMVTAHTESTAKLKTAAASASPAITPDPMLTAEQSAKLESLRGASGAAFDTAYVTEQRAAHDATLAALRDYAASGDVPSLKAFATQTVPIVAAHANMAKSLKP